MGQHRRFPASFLLVAAILAVPSMLVGIVHAAANADTCAAISKMAPSEAMAEQLKRGIKCEQ